ncbi:hypothetical protein B0H14DRAFT_3439316 [Mycena olivaceomarginata]|nr:hypothetical protein B0H14DRAFT_3439316 [Mycena olivaceomarginata]
MGGYVGAAPVMRRQLSEDGKGMTFGSDGKVPWVRELSEDGKRMNFGSIRRQLNDDGKGMTFGPEGKGMTF